MRGPARWTARYLGALSFCLTVLVFAAGAYGLWYRVTYYSWPGAGASQRLHYCGQDYQLQGPAQTWQQVSAQLHPGRVHEVAAYPPLGLRREQLLASEACTAILFAPAGGGRYKTYSLLGGG